MDALDDKKSHQILLVAFFTLTSWLGEYLHNSDLAELTLLSPENSIPALIALILFIAWWLLPHKKIPRLLLLTWAVLNLIGGGILSAIPFDFWPLGRLQTTQHLLKHAAYGLMQLPLIIALIRFK
jgi:hypothetical protein